MTTSQNNKSTTSQKLDRKARLEYIKKNAHRFQPETDTCAADDLAYLDFLD